MTKHSARKILPAKKYFLTAKSLWARGEQGFARWQLKEGVRHYPDDTHLLCLASAYALISQDYDSAEKYCRRALAIDPNAVTKANLGQIQLETGRIEEAKAGFRDILNSDPGNLHAVSIIASGLYQAELYEDAILVLEILRKGGRGNDASVAAMLDNAYRQAGIVSAASAQERETRSVGVSSVYNGDYRTPVNRAAYRAMKPRPYNKPYKL